jgi:hypothetical protein
MDSIKKPVARRLRIRLALYFFIFIIVLMIVIFHIVVDHANPFYALLGLAAGITLGIVASRMNKILWNADATEIISQFDTVGIIILILYVVFELFREKIVEQFVGGPSVIAVSFALLSGLMLGRVIGLRRKIRQVFESK